MTALLNEKCTPAALPEICAPRRELMEKIRRAAISRFIYLGAPAGSGKTVTALLWHKAGERSPEQHRSARHLSRWIGLDAYDNIPSVFYKLLASVFCSIQPDNENMRTILADSDFSSSPVEYAVRLLAEMLPDENQYTLTLDDLHLITNSDILKSLPLVLKRLPHSFTVLFLSRNEPPEELKGLFRDESAALIGVSELRFSEAELKAYFTSLGRNLTKEEAGFVIMASGGLAINVNAIAKSGHIDSDNNEYAFESYLRRYLWEKWDESLRDFMLHTSVVDEMSAELAAALTGRNDAPDLLRELCANNTFVSRTGHDMFRYHHLFLDFLRTMAKEINMDLSAANRAAAQYYLAAKQYLSARTYAVRSGDEEIIIQVMYQFQQYTNPSLDEYIAYSTLFNRDTLPENICERYPFLYTARMEAAWLSGDSKGAEYAFDKLWEHIPLIATKFPQFLETVIQEIVVDYRKPLTKLLSEFASLPPVVKPNKHYQVASLTIQLPFVHRCHRDFSELADKGVMEKFERSIGHLAKELWQAEKPCLQSGILFEQNCLEDALAFALQGKEAASNLQFADVQSSELTFTAHSQLSAIYTAMGNDAMLRKTLEEMEQYIGRSGARYLEHNFLALKTKFRLNDADKKSAETWLENYFVSDLSTSPQGEVSRAEERIPLYKIFQYFTTVRAYIVLNRGGKAADLIRRLIQFAKDYSRPLDLAEAMTLKACLDWSTGSRAEAAVCLEEVLYELQGRGFIRIVADEGAAVVPILKRIAASASMEDYIGKLDRSYIAEVLLEANGVSKQRRGITANMRKSGKPVKLSKQQKKMLELLAKGYKNQEIARISNL
ncbi:MAG: hypothetical protein LBH44_08620, partial [Treponema sp.]|nr:hypothetical protein [Treponema sp.]